MAKAPTPAALAAAERMKLLRKHFGLKTTTIVLEPQGHTHVIAVEKGRNKLTGGQLLSQYASAFKSTEADIAAYRDGVISLTEFEKRRAAHAQNAARTDVSGLSVLAKRLLLQLDDVVSLQADVGVHTMDELPEFMRRAALATVYLEGCSFTSALIAAKEAFDEIGETHGRTPKAWLDEVRDRVRKTGISGERPSIRVPPSSPKPQVRKK